MIHENKEGAPCQEFAPSEIQPSREDSKESMVLAILKNSVCGLNRFEAERAGDHALNSTIAVLRAKGHTITDEWEEVPARFGRMARVKRYRLVRISAGC